MTAAELAECLVPAPMRWCHVKPGDKIMGNDAQIWTITTCAELRGAGWRGTGRWQACATHGGRNHTTSDLDPDDVATVLLPAALRDAMTLTRDELGARLLERRGAA